jgi:amino-acid N-acetyltransferase
LKQLPSESVFRGSASYIANHRNTIAVYHIPGGLLDYDASFSADKTTVFRNLMNDVALTWLLVLKIVIVVGCRHQIEKRTGYQELKHGVRITDETI